VEFYFQEKQWFDLTGKIIEILKLIDHNEFRFSLFSTFATRKGCAEKNVLQILNKVSKNSNANKSVF
jgi:hypothetical protein